MTINEEEIARAAEEAVTDQDQATNQLLDILLPLARKHGDREAMYALFMAAQRMMKELGQTDRNYVFLELPADRSQPMEPDTAKRLMEVLPEGYILISPGAIKDHLLKLAESMEDQ
jgi:hypothetical protein